MADYHLVPWRTGRKVGRTIYACKFAPGELLGGDESPWIVASDEDVLIGMMDTPELAQAAGDAHNLALKPKS